MFKRTISVLALAALVLVSLPGLRHLAINGALAGEATLTIAATGQSSSISLGQAANSRGGQTFFAPSYSIKAVSVGLARVGVPTSVITLALKDAWNGTTLAAGTIRSSAVKSTTISNPTMVTVTFATPAAVAPGQTYYIVLSTDSYNSKKYYKWALAGNLYADGTALNTSGSPLSNNDGYSTVTYSVPDPDLIAPTMPAEVAAVWSVGQIDLSWAASTDNIGVTGYTVYRCQGLGCTPTEIIASTPGTFYSDPGAAATSSYYVYAITASDAAQNESPKSATVTVATLPFGFAQSISNPLSCTNAKTLEALVSCTTNHFGQFVAPQASELSDARLMIHSALDGACAETSVPASLTGIYSVRTFIDQDNGQTYCVLMEIKDANGDNVADRGWGSVIINGNAQRELSIAAAHPLTDLTTETQGIGVFKYTNSRTYLLAGARRDIGGTSSCQPTDAYSSSDAAHNVAMMLFAATAELNNWYGAQMWHQIQFHGMSASTCPGMNIYMTNGLDQTPAVGDDLLTLKANLAVHNPAWIVNVPGDTPSCSLNATSNVQARLLNGVDASLVCGTEATANSQKFFSAEQAPGYRSASDWIAAVEETWPVAGQ